MYKKFFGLRHDPFSVSPDPRFLFHTSETREALARLNYGIQKRKGFILLTGEVGTGKTTLLNQMLDWLRVERIPTAFIFNPQLGAMEFLEFMMADFHISYEARQKSHLLLRLNEWLMERHRAGGTAVLVVDEAQNVPIQVLEEIRLLTNLETSSEKFLQIVLAGQPELEEKLRQPQLRQLWQRITLRYRTQRLTLEETRGYIAERLRIAGGDGQLVFTPDAVKVVHKYARGIPRVINLLCEHALLSAYADQQKPVAAETIEQVARQFELDVIEPALRRPVRDEGADNMRRSGSPETADAAGATGPRLAISRSMARNPEYASESGWRLNGPASEQTDSNAAVAGAQNTSEGIKAPPEVPAIEPPAPEPETPRLEAQPAGQQPPSPLSVTIAPAAGPALVRQPSPVRAELQRLGPLPVGATPRAKSRALELRSLSWVLLAVAMASIVGGLLYFSRHRHQAATAAPNPPVASREVIRPATPPSLGVHGPLGAAMPTRETGRALAGPKVGRLTVAANVEGARISIDGRSDPRWLAPHTFSALPVGTHGIVVSKEGYEEAYVRVTVKEGNTNSVAAQLNVPVGVIDIVTNPPGLEVSIDGRPPTPSPVEATLQVGEHTYTVKRAGFPDYHGKITVKEGALITRKIDFGGTS